jgi:alpha-glucosidase (family GH31 glycosyl hydrolase)
MAQPMLTLSALKQTLIDNKFSSPTRMHSSINQYVSHARQCGLLIGCLWSSLPGLAQSTISTAGQPGQLDIRIAGEHSLRITLKPLSYKPALPDSPVLAQGKIYAAPVISIRQLAKPLKKQVGTLQVVIRPDPLSVVVTSLKGELIQTITFSPDGTLAFRVTDQPVLGLGEGGPKPEKGVDWRTLPVTVDRRGQLDRMQPRWQSDAYGSRNPVAMLVGTDGWGLFVAAPWGEVDLSHNGRGSFIPWKPEPQDTLPQTTGNQGLVRGKGLPPVNSQVPGLYDIFVFDAHQPAHLMNDLALVTGPAVMPPKWALGYMQSHRTLENDTQMMGIVDTFRVKKIPLDAVIYLGTGFTPRGWNTRQPSFDFNPAVFTRDPKAVLADFHKRHVKVVVHMVPWDRDQLPGLLGSIPAGVGERVDASHIQPYWQQHVGLVKTGVDAFWPDEGDWFNLYERIKRHQLYYQGPLSTTPNVRPWSLHRNGYLGVAQWGGWVWSGDTESSWKTLEAQIAVGINHSLSLSPYWGSDIGGFYPNPEKTGELYARWFQFGAFCPSFRSHGRTSGTILPWGWGMSSMGVREINGSNDTTDAVALARNTPLASSMNNPRIEPVVKQYAELRYQLLPYTYTLAWEARMTGMPFMRALWLHYPDEVNVRGISNQFLWGRDMLIAPVYEKDATSRAVYLPKGDWYDWWTNAKLSGGQTVTKSVDLATMPIYIRAGAIIPVDPIRQYTDQPVEAQTTLKIYGGSNGQFILYEDDGVSLNYLQGQATLTRLTWNDRSRELTIAPRTVKGSANSIRPRSYTLQLLPDNVVKPIRYTGHPITVIF